MGGRSTIVLLVLVLGLGGFIWFVERKSESTAERKDQARRAFRIDPGSVTFLRIDSTNSNVVCERRQGEWLMTSPVTARADAGALDRLLESFHSLSRSDVITESEREELDLDLAAYGLDQPRARITYGDEKRRQTVLVGRDAPLGGHLYVMEEGHTEIVVTGTNLLASLPSTSVDLRDRRLFAGLPGDVVRLDVRRSDGFLQLIRGKELDWRIQKPVEARAAVSAVQGFLDTLFGLSVAEFIAETSAGAALYGLDEPMAQLTIISGKGPGEQTLLLGKRVESSTNLLYAAVLGVDAVYAVADSVLESLRIRLEDLRDRRLVTLMASEIQHIAIRDDEKQLVLQRNEDGSWNVMEPRQYKADLGRVQLLLSEWTGARVERFIDNAPVTNALDSDRSVTLSATLPAATDSPGADAATARDAAQRVVVHVLDGPDEFGLVRVLREGEKTALAVNAAVLQAASVDPLVYRDREVLSVDPATVRSLSIQTSAGTWNVRREGTNDFRAIAPGQIVTDAAAIGNVLQALRSVRAAGYLSESVTDLELRGLATPVAQVTIGLTGESGISKTLLMGADAGPDSVYGMIRGQDAIFTVEKSIRDNVLRPLYKLPETQDSAELGTGQPSKPAEAQ